MQGRCVMIDLEANFGRSGRRVSHEDLIEVMRKDRVAVEAGDFVLFRTDFDQMLLDMRGRLKFWAGGRQRGIFASGV
jgi:hypothetical protein